MHSKRMHAWVPIDEMHIGASWAGFHSNHFRPRWMIWASFSSSFSSACRPWIWCWWYSWVQPAYYFDWRPREWIQIHSYKTSNNVYILNKMRWLLATSRRELEAKNALHLLSRYMTKLVVENWEVMWVRLAVGTSNQTKFVAELTLFIKTVVLAMLEVFAYETSKRFTLKEKGTL